MNRSAGPKPSGFIAPITGRSGAGKTTLAAGLLPYFRAKRIPSTTTRAPRPRETDPGYRYVTAEEFEALLRGGAFLWHMDVFGNRYGTRVADIDAALAQAEAGDLFFPILVPAAVVQLRAYARAFGKEHQVRPLYLDVPDESMLAERMFRRGDDAGAVTVRLTEDSFWRAAAQTGGYTWLNASQPPDMLLSEAMRIIELWRHRTSPR